MVLCTDTGNLKNINQWNFICTAQVQPWTDTICITDTIYTDTIMNSLYGTSGDFSDGDVKSLYSDMIGCLFKTDFTLILTNQFNRYPNNGNSTEI